MWIWNVSKFWSTGSLFDSANQKDTDIDTKRKLHKPDLQKSANKIENSFSPVLLYDNFIGGMKVGAFMKWLTFSTEIEHRYLYWDFQKSLAQLS
jgi:hypothetical protein